MVREIGFDDAYTFKFSAREGTPATRLPESWTITDEVASERLARLIATVRAGTRAINLGHARHASRGARGEDVAPGNIAAGAHAPLHSTVLIPGDDALIGQYVMVELTGTTGSTFTGAVVPTRAALPMAG